MKAAGVYQDRVNRVLDYVQEHLQGDLSLARLSRVGCFSPFHFHRIFQAITGETLNSHVRRVRLERATLLMQASPRKRLTEVALDAGFAGGVEFSRAFKNRYGSSPSSWDRRRPLEKSKICQAPETRPYYSLEELQQWKAGAQVRVRVRPLEAFRYVYIRVFQPYGSSGLLDAYRALIAWLTGRGTDFRDVFFIGMSLDDPAVTPLEQCRYDMGVAFPESTGGNGLLHEALRSRGRSRLVLPPGPSECRLRGFSKRDMDSQQVAAIRCNGDLGQVDRAWHYLYRAWLPSVDYEPADRPAMEVFIRLPEEIGWQTFDLQACIPVAWP